MKIVVFFIAFLLLGAFFIVSNNNLALIKPENVDLFITKYSSWFSKIFINIKNLTGNAVKMDWLP